MKDATLPAGITRRCLWLAAAALISTSTLAQDVLPLSGPAYRLAEAAYAAYARGEYRMAAEQAREAARLRPDSVDLQTLIKNARAAEREQQRGPAPSKPRGTQRLSRSLAISAVTPAGAANTAANAGYRAYEQGAFAVAVGHARKAVVLDSTNRQHWQLLTHALAASGQLKLAEQAAEVGISEAGDDGSLAALRNSIIAMQALPSTDQPGYDAAARAYLAYDALQFVWAAVEARQAVQLAPENLDYHRLLVDSLSSAGDTLAAEAAATAALRIAPQDAALLAQRGGLRQRLGKSAPAQQDYSAALAAGGLPINREIDLLAASGQAPAARLRFDEADADGRLTELSDLESAYLAAQVGNDQAALKSFERSDAVGALPNTAIADAGFAALGAGQDADAAVFFKRSIDATLAGELPMTPKVLFETRRAVAEVERTHGVIASLTYRGAVSGLGQVPGTNTDSLQAGVEGYWRPWGHQNGRYGELFARSFSTLYAEDDGDTGFDTTQAAVGARYKPLRELNLLGSLSRVFSPRDGRNDWLAQLAYSGGQGIDLRVDVPQWTTVRASAEVGRYLADADTYALANVEAGKSFRVGSRPHWVLFPHASIAADHDSTAIRRSAVGIGPGLSARYWFREDRYRAPRSWVESTLQYRFRMGGADRAEGVFFTTTLSY